VVAGTARPVARAAAPAAKVMSVARILVPFVLTLAAAG
jgi:hypothetical protein